MKTTWLGIICCLLLPSCIVTQPLSPLSEERTGPFELAVLNPEAKYLFNPLQPNREWVMQWPVNQRLRFQVTNNQPTTLGFAGLKLKVSVTSLTSAMLPQN
jgi:hypothetical protein